MSDYYKILGVDKKSTKDEIKKAYRKLSKKYHPDVNPNGEAQFKKVTEAYETLIDDNKRKNYDNPNPFGGFDPFKDFMNQFRGGNRQRQRKPKDRIIKVDISPYESFLGIKKELTYRVEDSCDQCRGTGGDSKTCGTCRGTGSIQMQVGGGFISQIIQRPCNVCQGKGKILVNACYSCNGNGKKNKFENVSVDIPKNVDSGDFIRIHGKGDFDIQLGQGDLILQINMIKKDGFEKINNDLIYTHKINIEDFINNNTLHIPHPSGDISVTLPETMETETPLRVKGKGYDKDGSVGDYYIKMNVVRKLKVKKDQ